MTTRRSQPRRRPGRPAQPVARATLLEIARGSFARHGYAGTSMRALATEAGLTKASLFHHFPTKEALYLEALASILGELRGLVTAARSAQGAFLDRLDELGTLAVQYVGTNPDAARLLTRELLGAGPFMERGGADVVQTILTVIEGFLRAGMADGTLPEQDPRQLALSIASLHLYPFAAPEVSSRFLEVDVFSEDHVAARTRAIIEQVRRLCGAPV